MPVKIGDNLTLEDNKLSAVYKELYTKLNKAYAWTNTIDLSSSGSVTCINGLVSSTSPNIITTLPNNSGDNISISDYYHGTLGTRIYGIIINGEIYYRPTVNTFVKIGNNNNYIHLAATGTTETSGTYHIYAINNLGELYDIVYNKSNSTYTETQIGTDTDWNDFCGLNGNYVGVLKNKKFYTLYNGTPTLNTTYQNYNFDKLMTCVSSNNATTLPSGSIALIDNNLYCFKTTFKQMGNMQFKDFIHVASYDMRYCSCAALGYDDKWYFVTYDTANSSNNHCDEIGSNLLKCIVVNPFFDYSYARHNILKITSDYKLYFGGAAPSLLPQICPSIQWKDAIGTYKYADNGYPLYAISTDGELYLITNSTTAIKINDSTGFQKLVGYAWSNTTPSFTSGLVLALSYGDEGSFKSTIYTTKNPIVDDYAYIDNTGNFSYAIDTKITNVNGNNSITTQSSKTYYRDNQKDSSFTFIPPGTMRDTITVAEMLAATNSNN